MKKLFSLLFLFIKISFFSAQNCVPDSQYVVQGPGVYPDSIVGLPPAYTCQPYSGVITVVVPYDTIFNGTYMLIDSAVLKSVDDLPPNFSYSCEPPNCNFPGGTSGCILIFGSPQSADTGSYIPVGNVLGYVSAFPGVGLPYAKIDYYTIDINLGGGPISAAIETFSPISCNGNCNGAVTAIATCGFPPFTYNWSNGSTTQTITGLCAGNYSVTISDTSGSSVANYLLSQPAPLSLSFVQTDPSGGCNGSIVVNPSGGTAPYNYTWNTTDTNQSINNLCGGVYQVTVTDAGGCPPVINAVFLMTGVEKFEDSNAFLKVFPNPSEGKLTVCFTYPSKEIKGEMKINNLLGETVFKTALKSEIGSPQNFEIDISKVLPGQYILQMANEKEFFYDRFVVVR